MTILFGASCDDGVIVATDSVRVVSRSGWGWLYHPPKKTIELERTTRKIARIGDRVAFVASGSGFRWETTGAGLEHLATVDEIAPELFARIEKSVGPLVDDSLWAAAGKPEFDDVQLLIGGGPLEATPEIVFVRRAYALAAGTPAGPVELTRVPRRGLVARGVMTDWARNIGLERVVLPALVGDALPVIVALCHACVAYWRALLRGVTLIGFPLQFVVITPERSFTNEVAELAPAIGDILMQELRTQGLAV